MRVVHVIGDLSAGGAETMLYKLLGARDAGAEVARVVSLTDVGSIGVAIRTLGVPVTALGMKRGRPEPASLFRLVRLLRQERPDVVQTWMYHSDLLGGVAARLAGIPVVWGVRHDVSNTDKPLTRLTRRACALLSGCVPAAIVFNSEASRRAHAAAGYAARRLVVVPNGFDLARFRPDASARAAVRAELGIAAEAPVVGLVARYHADKGYPDFLAAADRIRSRCASVHFVLCGEGVEEGNAELMALVDRYGLRPAVSLLGRRDDVERVMAALDVCCLSSRTESFPNAIGEAMACGVPCVATDCGDVLEIIGETGRVVPVGAPQALSDATVELLQLTPAARRALGDAARARVAEGFALTAVQRAFHEVHRRAALPPTDAAGRRPTP